MKEESSTPIKQEHSPRQKSARKRSSAINSATRSSKRIKSEPQDEPAQLPSPSSSSGSAAPQSPSTPPNKTTKTKGTPDALRDRKLKAHLQYAGAKASPFPDFPHPTPAEAKLAHKILTSLHGARKRPAQVIARSDRAGCGDSPSVLDALVRTILSQNTSDTNSTRAKRSMDAVYGGSDRWDAIAQGGQSKLQEAIKCGGLSVVKSKVIISILNQCKEKYGEYSLDHLHEASTEDAMQELLGFQGVGPKTASCVLLFCLQREDFAVDTHVYRITGLLGWRPKVASREETYAHLNVKIPDEDKYGLHILLVGHGKKCDECRAGGKSIGKCELRKAFRKGKLDGEAGMDVKEEEEKHFKDEDA
jgi:endonuclease III